MAAGETVASDVRAARESVSVALRAVIIFRTQERRRTFNRQQASRRSFAILDRDSLRERLTGCAFNQ
jgi:hypothetical protein